MGWLWPVLHPLLMLSIYTYVFGSVFGARWGHSIPVNNRWHFALMLFSGLICFNMIAECISRSPVLIVSQVNYVKRVVFPLEIISVVQIGAVLFQAMLNLFVLSIFMYMDCSLIAAAITSHKTILEAFNISLFGHWLWWLFLLTLRQRNIYGSFLFAFLPL